MYQDKIITRAVTERFIQVMQLLIGNEPGVSNMKQFAEKIGASQQTVSKWSSGVGNVTVADLVNMCSRFRVSPAYLILGYGDMLLKQPAEIHNGNLERQLSGLKRKLREIEILTNNLQLDASKTRNKKPEQLPKKADKTAVNRSKVA